MAWADLTAEHKAAIPAQLHRDGLGVESAGTRLRVSRAGLAGHDSSVPKAVESDGRPSLAERYAESLSSATVRDMGVLEAAGWGLAGGLVAGLLGLSASVVAANYRWPWRNVHDGIWPHLFVATAGLLVGGLVAASAHAQMTGAWPALIMGACAPSVIRGILARVEVVEGEPASADPPIPDLPATLPGTPPAIGSTHHRQNVGEAVSDDAR